MAPFYIPDAPADDDLYNAACAAPLDLEEGRITEDGYRLILERYEAAERAHWSAAWNAAA